MQEDVRVERLACQEELGRDGKPLRRWQLTGVVTDVTERKLAEEALWWRANRDSLTGIPNREWIRERIETDLKEARLPQESRPEPGQGALFVLDLDGFKYVNDSLGHEAGDRMLQTIASRIETVLQTEVRDYGVDSTCARLGGDEFVIWVPRLSASDRDIRSSATHIAECLLKAISQPTRLNSVTLGKRELLMTGCIGIAVSFEDGTDTETLFMNADTALYQAKEAGRGKYRFHSQERSTEVANRLVLETRLRLAIKNEALTLCYQPQVDILTGRVVGVEALLRWHDQELGTVSPSTFIPLAEEIGLIHALGTFALREACKQATKWRQQLLPSLRICVNLSALQLVEAGMIQIVLSALEEANLPGEALELEITETALFRSGEHGAANFLREARSRGMRLAIDDFGTGYSSLSYLRNVPVDVVKIDCNFIRDITENRQTRSIVRAMIDLSHALGLTVTAEGVETEGQKVVLAALNCDTFQGFLFSRPVSAQDVESLLNHCHP